MALLHCELYSKALRMPTSVLVLLPQDMDDFRSPAKTLYLLHGRSHNYSVWQRYTSLERYAAEKKIAVIMPEVNRSFYSDMEYGVDYFRYITAELPELCEAMFQISRDASDRFIAGMSMGGYGALKAALTRPDFYAGCAAVSAVTDIRKHVAETPETDPKKKEFRGIFGKELQLKPTDDLYELARKVSAEKNRPDFYFACGTEDHLYEEGKAFRIFLEEHGFSVTAQEWHGIHDWTFWDEAIRRVLSHYF